MLVLSIYSYILKECECASTIYIYSYILKECECASTIYI